MRNTASGPASGFLDNCYPLFANWVVPITLLDTHNSGCDCSQMDCQCSGPEFPIPGRIRTVADKADSCAKGLTSAITCPGRLARRVPVEGEPMKSKPASQRKWQPAGVRCIALFLGVCPRSGLRFVRPPPRLAVKGRERDDQRVPRGVLLTIAEIELVVEVFRTQALVVLHDRL